MVERANNDGEGQDWRTRAACRDSDPEVFFPTAAAGPELASAEAAAKAVCAGCPVRAACLAWALKVLPHGIAGGMSGDERAEHRRTARPPGRVRRAPAGLPLPTRSPRGAASEHREAAAAALAAGRDRDRVAAECGVSRRTVDRWAAALREQQTVVVAGGAR